jgi:hypothetical protein
MLRLARAVLAIADISGYTHFVHQPDISIVHAEEIITALLETVIDRAAHPLTLNKFEGDAALLYAEFEGPAAPVVADILVQADAFFAAFATTRLRLQQDRSGCGCEACRGIDRLGLKILLHLGDIAIKQIREHTELAGKPLIVLHRLLKNEVPGREYLLLTAEFLAPFGSPPAGVAFLQQEIADLEPVRIGYRLESTARAAANGPGPG